jgi:glutamate N-acetyltransferase/amino-acid N-acetyltransferase
VRADEALVRAAQITVDGDTSTNDCVVALASGLAGNETVQDPDSKEAVLLQAALTALLQGLAKTIAWDGEGATVCIEVCALSLPLRKRLARSAQRESVSQLPS